MEAESPGDYYNQKGEKIGSDGINDGNVYVVRNGRRTTEEVKIAIEGKDLAKAQKLSVLLPNIDSRTAMGIAAEETGLDQEQGGVGLLLEGGTHIDARVLPGPVAALDAMEAHLDLAVNPKNILTLTDLGRTQKLVLGDSDSKDPFKLAYDYHTHPKGEKWKQTPSDVDIARAKANGDLPLNRYVLSPKTNTVYIYDGTGTLAKFPLNSFTTIKAN